MGTHSKSKIAASNESTNTKRQPMKGFAGKTMFDNPMAEAVAEIRREPGLARKLAIKAGILTPKGKLSKSYA